MYSRKNYNKIKSRYAVLIILLVMVSCTSAKPPVNAGTDGIAIKGFDPVAYFTMGKPVRGNDQFTYEWKSAKWLFSSREHLYLFSADPEKYAPQYGGYCAFAVSRGTTADIDPVAWSIVNGKLYLNLNKDIQKHWSNELSENIIKADKNWPSIIKK
jgi:YHS domain-containing protein